MALRVATQSNGVEISSAYVKVFMPTIQPGKDRIEFGVHYLAGDMLAPFKVESYACDYDLEGENPIMQAYSHLKMLPEFTAAHDA
ncbi:hypothetical protein [Pseudomonas sp. BF-R-19]|uniref:hypothetical protein n=1 Tax=Pseudomonas sp. BF-R-19 TaxID=2832397 RepID=UPI001CBDB3DC|nr:hypothetical protein [Pseudomonas sp. BF-R-19]